MDRNYQTAGEQDSWKAHIKMEREAQLQPRISGAKSWMSQAQVQAASVVGSADNTAGNQQLRVEFLEMALRTPGVNGCREVLLAAAAYQSKVLGA